MASPVAVLNNITAIDVSSLFAHIKSHSLALLGVGVLLVALMSKKSKGKRPPGPKGLPLIGNIHQMSMDAWFIFAEWKEKYGPLVSINLAGKNVIIINNYDVAADLDKRAQIYSDRPRFIVSSDLLCGGLFLVFTSYGDLWRRMRKAAHEGFNPTAANNYHTLQETEATVLTNGLLEDGGKNWDAHLRRASASQVMAMLYDAPPILDHKAEVIVRVNDQVERIVKAAYPGEHIVEFLPFLNKLPDFLAPWKPWAAEWHRKDSVLFEGLYKTTADRVLAGDDRPSLVSSLVKKKAEHKLSERQAAWVAGVNLSAGSETTAAAMAWWMLAMTMYPEVQRKAQEEIDNVVGRDRMPTIADLESMPYIRAMVRETLRWRPVDPMGLQHQTSEDDEYNGYFIPKGTLVIYNVWSMHRDTSVYGEDVDEFNPERYLTADGTQLKPVHPATKGEGQVSYGFGRRICVGRYVANNTLFADIAQILWACTISPAKNPDGTPMTYDKDAYINGGLVVRPKPFVNSIKPRFPGAAEMVAEEAERLVAAANER